MGKSLKGKELGKGISQRKDGLYQARFINRFGKRQTIYAKTYNDITKKLRDAQYEDEKQINVVTSNMTLDEWYNVWMTTCKKHCRDTTRRTYSVQYNRLREELGWRKLTNLNLVIIQNAFNNLKSDKSRRDCKALLVDMLNRAFESDLVNKNVAVSVNTKIDGTEQPEKRVLTPDEIQVLYQSTRNSQLYPFFVLALNTGMRMGDDDDKIRLNQRKPSKYKGLRRFGPEKNLQRINKFMKERPIFYKNLIQMKENIRFYLRCFYCITKVMILQFNSENRTELARNG